MVDTGTETLPISQTFGLAEEGEDSKEETDEDTFVDGFRKMVK